jgi:hypothetical protein
MGWEFDMVAGPFNPRVTEGPAWDGQGLLFTSAKTTGDPSGVSMACASMQRETLSLLPARMPAGLAR